MGLRGINGDGKHGLVRSAYLGSAQRDVFLESSSSRPPYLWYGFFFALGFLFAYLLVRFVISKELVAYPLNREISLEKSGLGSSSVRNCHLDRNAPRRPNGDLLFYQGIGRILRSPWEIFTVWEGGLASHGGVIGIVIALWWSSSAQRETVAILFFYLVDLLRRLPLGGAAIRIGNFFNQEILGKASNPSMGGLVSPSGRCGSHRPTSPGASL